MKLDRATIITEDLEAARRFLCSIVGLSEGPRPPFGVKGHWLYADGRPAIHLIRADTTLATQPASPRVDHIALRIDSTDEWSALLERMRLSGVSCEFGEVPLSGERQLFIAMAPGVVIELVTDPQSCTP